MGLPVLVVGDSGTGKSASLRNFKADHLKHINVANKPLPFKNKFESIPTDDYKTILKELKLNRKKVTVIDDAQYLMANEFMRRATERGYDKFTEIAQNFWTLVNAVKDLPADHIVYFMAHIERDANGNEKMKTIGKMLDEKITVEGMFTIVLKTNVTDGKYSFLTQNSGHDTVKSPIGMFPSYAIDNDLKYVDDKIRNYYEIGEFLSDEEMAEIDEAAKKDDVPFEDGKKKRSRRNAKKEEPENTPQEEKKEETKGRRTKEDVPETNGDNNDNEPVESNESDSSKVSEQGHDSAEDESEEPSITGQPRRRRGAQRSREEVAEQNAKNVAESNQEDKREEVPFEEASEPEVEKLPRRSRKDRSEEEAAMTPPIEETPAEEPTTRRRRRR